MKKSHPRQSTRRALLRLAVLSPWTLVPADVALSGAMDPSRRFKGIGVVLVVDAIAGVEMEGVVFYDDRELPVYASSVVARRNRETMALGGARVPLFVRVIWRDHPEPVWGNGGIDYQGPIVGNYTVPVAERIPDEVLSGIRKNGGALRLKFRLKPDGVLFGWDIERDGRGSGYVLKYDMPGGDFKEARMFNGKAAELGWYIGPDGRKVETDY